MEISLTIDNGKAIATELCSYGVRCRHTKTIESARLFTHFFELERLQDILKLNKAIKILEVAIGKAVAKTEKAEAGCFGLEIAKDELTVLSIEEPLKKVKPFELLVGEDTNSKTVEINLDDTPHLLVAGCTGSGKSVLLNNFVKCILQTNKELDNYKLLIIDPKKVGFSKYNNVNGTDVATDVKSAYYFLKWAVTLMEERYEDMQKRRIDKWDDWRVVIIIDEFSDLILTAKETIETFIVKLAQMGRACGIHLIIATQRPTVNVVTGLIKANIADRIALQVATAIDSRVILDQNGAEKLKGQGDCLVKINGETKRVQCFYSK